MSSKIDMKLLRDLTTILNAHQDIEDAFRECPTNLRKIKAASAKIGKAVVRHLPG